MFKAKLKEANSVIKLFDLIKGNFKTVYLEVFCNGICFKIIEENSSLTTAIFHIIHFHFLVHKIYPN